MPPPTPTRGGGCPQTQESGTTCSGGLGVVCPKPYIKPHPASRFSAIIQEIPHSKKAIKNPLVIHIALNNNSKMARSQANSSSKATPEYCAVCFPLQGPIRPPSWDRPQYQPPQAPSFPGPGTQAARVQGAGARAWMPGMCEGLKSWEGGAEPAQPKPLRLGVSRTQERKETPAFTGVYSYFCVFREVDQAA